MKLAGGVENENGYRYYRFASNFSQKLKFESLNSKQRKHNITTTPR
jgi:hypothetical protein